MPKLRIEFTAYLLAAILLLILPLKWLMAAAAAAVFHELCHVIAIYLTGGNIWNITVSAGGAVIETSPMSLGRELFCALAGPAGGLFLLLFVKWIPCTALLAGIQSIYNLFPLYPLDGGRALRCGLELMIPAAEAERVCGYVEFGVIVSTVLLGMYAAIMLKTGGIALMFIFVLCGKILRRKIPCKKAGQRVQ